MLFPINRRSVFDEVAVFQGASYFRSLGEGQVYGLSARGLANKTAEPEGEEFPAFRALLDRRAVVARAQTLVVHALLDSPSVAGAYRFEIHPAHGATARATTMDIEAVLFPRVELGKVGLAPLTSMFMFSPNGRISADDFRPEVHDSDGLLMFNGRGEHIWRPLQNPAQVEVSAFLDVNPVGFGLLQRDRNPADYQDFEAVYDRRPSLWIEPVGGWGEGAVVLTEIPSDAEIHDNVVAFWRPKAPLPAGNRIPICVPRLVGGRATGGAGADARRGHASGSRGRSAGRRRCGGSSSTICPRRRRNARRARLCRRPRSRPPRETSRMSSSPTTRSSADTG